MSLPQATWSPVYGQSFTFPIRFFNNTGGLITGWTGIAASVIVEGGGVISLSGGELPAENSGSGVGICTLSAAHMTGKLIQFTATVSNANANACSWDFFPAVLSEQINGSGQGGWDVQTIITLENLLLNIAAVVRNAVAQLPGSITTQTVQTVAGAPYLSGSVVQNNVNGATRGKLT